MKMRILLVMCVLFIAVSAVSAEPLSTPSFTIGVIAATGPDTINATAGYRVADVGDYRLFLDILYGFESDSFGAGLSVRTDSTGVQIIDTLKDIFRLDGVGGGMVTKRHQNPTWLLYGVCEF